MKKLFLIPLMACSMLFSISMRAQNTCKIGTVEYESLSAAVAAVPANDVPTTITMIADENAGAVAEKLVTIAKLKNVVLDLNNHTIASTSLTTLNKKESAIIENKGTLTIKDGSLEGNGKLSYSYVGPTEDYSSTKSCIINNGTLKIESGNIVYRAEGRDVIGYAVDNITNGNLYPHVSCTMTGGSIDASADYEAFRLFANSTTALVELNLLGGSIEAWGVVFAQDPQSSRSGKMTVNVAGGDYDVNDENGYLVRIYTTGVNNLAETNINISGGVCDGYALYIQHTTRLGYDLYETRDQLAEQYPSVFNITGGTFATDEFKRKANYVIDSNGTQSGEPIVSYHTLPTIVNEQYLVVDNGDGTKTIYPAGIVYSEPGTNEWDGTWQGGDPDDHKVVMINHDVTVQTTEAEAYTVTVADNKVLRVAEGQVLNIGDGGLNLNTTGKLIVEAGAIVRVGSHGVISSSNKQIEIYSSTAHSAVLAIAPTAILNNHPAVTVKLATKAYMEDENNFVWQYLGNPMLASSNMQWGAVETSIYDWSAQKQDWTPVAKGNDVNKPFHGYVFTNKATEVGTEYTMNGQIVGNGDAVLNFDVRTDGGNTAENWNFFANSYLAPIDLASFFANIAVGDNTIERTVWIYNTSTGAYEYASSSDVSAFASIPPMQAFFINLLASTPAAATINYATSVWGKEKDDPMHAPSRQNMDIARIMVSAGNVTDRVNLYESDRYTASFENGADVTKMMNGTINLYAVTEAGNLAGVADSNMDGIVLRFEASDAAEYTMSFVGTGDMAYAVKDMKTGKFIALDENESYTFYATPESKEDRFMIVGRHNVSTDVEQTNANAASTGVYNLVGAYIGEMSDWNNLPAGVYVVNGQKIIK